MPSANQVRRTKYGIPTFEHLVQGHLGSAESMEGQIRQLLPGKDASNIVRQAKRGEALSTDVERTIATHAQITLFSDNAFGWEVHFGHLRELMLCAISSRLRVHLDTIDKQAKDSVDPAFKAKSHYCTSIGEFRLSNEYGAEPDLALKHLDRAIQATKDLKETATSAGLSLSPLFKLIAAVNAAAFDWQRMAITGDTDHVRRMAICKTGQAACINAMAEQRRWIGVYRDAAEYTAMLVANGDVVEADVLEDIIRRTAGIFVSRPANQFVAVMRSRMEPAAMKEIEKSKTFLEIESMTKGDHTGHVKRIPRDYLVSTRERKNVQH